MSALPDQLSDDDLALLRPALKQVFFAQNLIAYLLTHLRPKYQMTERDEIDENGRIIRQES